MIRDASERAALTIGSLPLRHPTVLGPMAALTDIAFRELLDGLGGVGLMISEMVSAEGVRRRNRRTLDMLRTFESTTPQFVQLFGADVNGLAEAARIIEDETSFQGIDLNFGCPAGKVTRRGAGAALLQEPGRVRRLAQGVRQAVSLPVSAKIRLGYQHENLEEVIPSLHEAGVDAITVHFRLKSDGYATPARWEFAAAARRLIQVPLIGNGDINTPETARLRLAQVDAVMIGRGALQDPLIFQKLQAADAGVGPGVTSPTAVVSRLLDLIERHYTPEWRLNRIKAYARFLLHHRIRGKQARQRLYAARDYPSAKAILLAYLGPRDET